MELIEIRKKLKKVQVNDRYEHTKGVMYTAGFLAMAYCSMTVQNAFQTMKN